LQRRVRSRLPLQGGVCELPVPGDPLHRDRSHCASCRGDLQAYRGDARLARLAGNVLMAVQDHLGREGRMPLVRHHGAARDLGPAPFGPGGDRSAVPARLSPFQRTSGFLVLGGSFYGNLASAPWANASDPSHPTATKNAIAIPLMTHARNNRSISNPCRKRSIGYVLYAISVHETTRLLMPE